jgi:hypothetical protein
MKGRLILTCNGETLDIEDIWMEKGAIWIEASTRAALYDYKPGTPTGFEVYGQDGTLVQRPNPGSFDCPRIRPGDAIRLKVSLISQQLQTELEDGGVDL